MKQILLTLTATICLNGCTSQEVEPFQEYQYNIELTKVDSGLYEAKCFKRLYRVWVDKVGPLEKFHEAPIAECSKLFGYQPVPNAKLAILLDYARNEAVNNCHGSEPVFPGTAERED